MADILMVVLLLASVLGPWGFARACEALARQ